MINLFIPVKEMNILFLINFDVDSSLLIIDLVPARDSSDTPSNIEKLQFSDVLTIEAINFK